MAYSIKTEAIALEACLSIPISNSSQTIEFDVVRAAFERNSSFKFLQDSKSLQQISSQEFLPASAFRMR